MCNPKKILSIHIKDTENKNTSVNFGYSEKDPLKHLTPWKVSVFISNPYFPAFGLNTDQKNSEYEHFSNSVYYGKFYENGQKLSFADVFQNRYSEICTIFKNTFFYKTAPVAASE